jgi:hypothetical protein
LKEGSKIGFEKRLAFLIVKIDHLENEAPDLKIKLKNHSRVSGLCTASSAN